MRPSAAVVACLLAPAAIGCGTGERADDLAAVAERFHAALDAGNGQAACAELAEETSSKLERQEGKPCDAAILGLALPKGGSVSFRRMEVRSGVAQLAEGGTDFLDEGSDGWKISAAGCEPSTPGRPYECELEG